MAKTINKILALALMTLLCMTVVTALESDDEKEEPAENPNNEEFPDEKDNLIGNGEFAANITVINNKDGAVVPGASIYGFNEGEPDGDWREFQEVKGLTDANGSITFHLDSGKFQFWTSKEKYFETFFSLEIKGAVNHTINITPFPPESSVVKGYVKDGKTGETLPDVELVFNLMESPLLPKEPYPPGVPVDEDNDWEEEEKEGSSGDSDGSYGYSNYYQIPMKYTHTDPKGHYSVKLIPGTYYVDAHLFWKDIYLEDEREGPEDSSGNGDGGSKEVPGNGAEYIPFSTKIVTVENESAWLNISLEPLPPVDALIKGYARDEDGNGVGDAWIYVFPSFMGSNGEVPEGKPEDAIKDDTRDDGETASGGGSVGSVDTAPAYYPGYGNEYFGYTEKDGYYEIPLRVGDYIMTVSPPYYYGGDDDVVNEEKPMPGNDEGGESKEGNRGEEVEDVESVEAGTTGSSDNEARPDGGNLREHKFEFHIDGKETIWHNVTFKNLPKKDAKITGIVKDRDTGEIVSNSEISIYGGEIFMYFATNVDENGKFSMNVYPGYYYINVRVVEDLYLKPEEYKEKYGEDGADSDNGNIGGLYKVETPYFPYSTELEVQSGETTEIDILLKPKPKDVVKIEGFVRDAATKAPLTHYHLDATIITDEYVLHNNTYTDETGHYEIYVPPGDIILATGGNYYLKYRQDGTDSSGEKSDDNYWENAVDYFPAKFITRADSPGTITKDFEMEERIIPDDETFSATFEDGTQNGDGYIEIAVFDTGRGVDYQGYGGWNDAEYQDDKVDSGTRSDEIGMRLPPGSYKAFAYKTNGGAVFAVSEVSSFEIIAGGSKDISLKLEIAEANSGEMKMDFGNTASVKVVTNVHLGGPALMMKASIENELGNGDMVISASEKLLIEKYTSITENPIIRPVLSLGGIPFVIDDETLSYEFSSNLEGEISPSPIDMEIAFTMDAVGDVDLEKNSDFDLNIKGPFSMEVECTITLPKEMKLEDGTRTFTKQLKIKAGNVWEKGLSEDFDERVDGEVPASDKQYDAQESGANYMGGGDELASDEGLKLTIFYAETDIQPKAGLSDTTIMYIGVVVLAALVFVVVFLVFRKRGKKPEEEPEKEMDNK
ncbi:MAG: hypothetical protein QGH39_02545 [Candidatus Thermoplasmatota archaeon]|jgi:hypothetical protein|nr:hypothetical protein [Candidatus Thermoplasmatota archaeon]MDP7264419.1 hypothetical protein [Candidatus Thermoplasmatota archaeon]